MKTLNLLPNVMLVGKFSLVRSQRMNLSPFNYFEAPNVDDPRERAKEATKGIHGDGAFFIFLW